MNILTSYTLRCLKQNRVRTLVTLIGIILSVALFTAVAEGAYSGQQYLIRVTTAENGSYHGVYEGLSDRELEALKAEPSLTRLSTLTDVGWALVGDPARSEPYLRIVSMSAGFPDLVSVRLKEGRMPQNEHELLISDMAGATGATFFTGDTLQLQVGKRVSSYGDILTEHNPYMQSEERLTELREQEYTVVGVYDRFSYDIESSSMPGALALTVGVEGPNSMAFFTLADMGDTADFLEAHPYGSSHWYNRELLMFSGYTENENLVTVLYGLTAILFALIFFGSVALIYNSFSISVSERTKQFGLLKSIGTTDRQIRRTVLTEALLLCVVGIPLGLLVGCGGIGLTLRFLQSAFQEIVNIDGAEGVTIQLALDWPALALAAGIGLLTALISAWIPARRAARLAPIAAIRQSADVKIRAGKVKVSSLTGKLFGFPGTLAAKNFKRSRKQYRSTVISLFMSIVLFISAFSFSEALRGNVADNLSEESADVVAALIDPSQFPADLDYDAMLRQMTELEQVEEGAWAYFENCSSSLPKEAISQPLLELAEAPELQSIYFNVFFVPDAYYAALCREAGVDPASGQGLAYADSSLLIETGRNSSYRQHFSLLRREALPVSVTLFGRNLLDYSEYLIESIETDESGAPIRYGCRLPDNVISPDADDQAGELIYFRADEVQTRFDAVIGGLLEEPPLVFYNDGAPALYLPLSQKPAPLESKLAQGQDSGLRFYLKATNHAIARDKLSEYLDGLCVDVNRGYFHVQDNRANSESTHALLLVLDVFTFGFIILISLIAAANVFNTISTNVALRRREFATLKSVGMGNRAFGRMMRFECLLYGAKALLWGLPVSLSVSYLIWRVVDQGFRSGGFRLPWTAMGIAAGSVFLVVFATMFYATWKIRRDNPIDALKQETL